MPTSAEDRLPGETASDDPDRLRDARLHLTAELAGAALWVLIGVAVLIESRDIRLVSVQDPIGPRFIPQFLAGSLIALGLVVAFRQLRGARDGFHVDDEMTAEDFTERPASTKRGLVALSLTIGYVLALPVLGYIAATAIASMAMMLYLRQQEPTRVLVVWAIALSLATNYLFTNLLNVQLPSFSLF